LFANDGLKPVVLAELKALQFEFAALYLIAMIKSSSNDYNTFSNFKDEVDNAFTASVNTFS
jgi:hypothetical protein